MPSSSFTEMISNRMVYVTWKHICLMLHGSAQCHWTIIKTFFNHQPYEVASLFPYNVCYCSRKPQLCLYNTSTVGVQ